MTPTTKTGLVTISLSMHVRCASCQGSIHLGAIVDRARCPECGKIEPLPPERWLGFLDEAVNDGPNLPHEEAQIRHDDDNAWVTATARNPKCGACNQPFPKTAVENARKNGKCFCVGCGAKIGVRPVPPAFAEALPCITHLIGEDGTQIKTPDAPLVDSSQVVSLRCPDCGGNIQPDGRSHAVRCPYCSVLVVLSQSIWARLTGKNDAHVFYLVHDRAIPRPLGRADVQWGSLDEIVCDSHGNLYGIAEDDRPFDRDKFMVFALDHRLKTKWVHRSIEIDDEGHIAWRPDGVLLVWSPRRYSAILLRAFDGQEIGKIGGEQPKGLDRHILDLSRAESLAIDPSDGTILFSKRDRLARCAPDGSAQFTWPPGQGLFGGIGGERLKPFTENDEDDPTSLYEAGDRPWKLRNVKIRIGWDGRTYLQDSDYVYCYDRMGKKLYGVEVSKENKRRGTINDFGIDARGAVYLLCWTESYTSSVYRMLPGGALSLLVDGCNPHTPIREERRLALHPDGTMIIAAYGRAMRIFAPDGRLLYLSEKCVEEDQRHAKRKAEEARGDRVR